MKKTLILVAQVERVPAKPKSKFAAGQDAHYKVTLKNGQTFTMTVAEYRKAMSNS